MASLTWIPEALALLPWVLIGVVLLSLVLALWLPRTRRARTICTLVVLCAWGALYLRMDHAAEQSRQRRLAQQQESKARLEASQALFEERCKTAGEKITRTVDNVEGVVWMKWRLGSANQTDQFKLDDPYGHDCSEEGCILQLVRITNRSELLPEDVARHHGRYAFVESVDPRDGKTYRYTGAVKAISQRTPAQIEAYKRNSNGVDPGPDVWGLGLERQPIGKPSARYGITWDDLSTREDREHWIAGGSLKVIDLQTNEVIAERIGYMIDAGQGNTGGGRQPWTHAAKWACPTFSLESGGSPFLSYRSRDFGFRVLKPAASQGSSRER